MGGGCGDWMELAQDRDRWWALVNIVMNLQVPKMRGISWLAAEPVSFSRRTLLHGVSKYNYMGNFNKSNLMANNQSINIIWCGWNSCISICLIWLSLILGWGPVILLRFWILLLKNQREEGENVACLNCMKWWTNLAVTNWDNFWAFAMRVHAKNL